MYWSQTLSLLLLLVATLVSTTIAIYIWRVRSLHGARRVMLLILAVTVWVSLYLLELFSATLSTPFSPLRAGNAPLFMIATGLAVGWILAHYRFVSLVPIARHTVVEQMSDAVLVINANNIIVDLNPAALQLLGFSSTVAIGKPCKTVLADWPELVQCCHTANDAQFELLWKTNPPRSFEVQIRTLYDQRGRINGRLLIWHDITERKQEQEVLQDALVRFQAIFDNTPLVAIQGFDQHGVIHHWNAVCQTYYGYSAAEADGQRIQDLLLQPHDVAAFEAMITWIWAHGQPIDPIEWQVHSKSGEERWLYSVMFPIFKRGQISEIFCMDVDITERKRTEERFRQMADNINEGLIIIENNLPIYINDRACAIFGCSRDEFLHKTGLDFAAPEEYERLKQFFQAIRKANALPAEVEFWALRPDGSRRYVLNRYSARVIQGHILSRYVLTSDITERKQAEIERERLQAQLLQSRKMEAIGQLAGGVAHDFNNILTVITGNADLALDSLSSYHPAYSDIQAIQKSARRAAYLVRQLLTFARRQANHPEVVDINELVLNIIPMLRRLIGEHIELLILPELRLGSVKIDPHQFEQVLINLVVNARDAMPNGGQLAITTTNVQIGEQEILDDADTTAGNYVLLTVSDTGIGMSDSIKSHIFEPYFTTKDIGQGTGLGLATSLGIIKQHHGTIWVESSPGEGSQFKVYIPVTNEPAPQVEGAMPVVNLGPGTGTVLVVEDELEVRQLAVRILRDHGYTVMEATNGQEALRLVETLHDQEFHLLLTDLVMPMLGGRELAHQLQAQFPNLQVLFMSGYADQLSAGNDGASPQLPFIQKPFTQADLLLHVRELLSVA